MGAPLHREPPNAHSTHLTSWCVSPPGQSQTRHPSLQTLCCPFSRRGVTGGRFPSTPHHHRRMESREEGPPEGEGLEVRGRPVLSRSEKLGAGRWWSVGPHCPSDGGGEGDSAPGTALRPLRCPQFGAACGQRSAPGCPAALPAGVLGGRQPWCRVHGARAEAGPGPLGLRGDRRPCARSRKCPDVLRIDGALEIQPARACGRGGGHGRTPRHSMRTWP